MIGFEIVPLILPCYGAIDYVGIAMSKDSASELFSYCATNIVLCVDVPRARYCASLRDAHAFFDEGAELIPTPQTGLEPMAV